MERLMRDSQQRGVSGDGLEQEDTGARVKTALILGITGQYGAYHAHLLLGMGNRVVGSSRDAQIGVVPVQWTGCYAACLTENEHHDPTTPPFYASAKGRGHCSLPKRGTNHFRSIQTPWNSRQMLGPLDSANRD